MIGDGWDGDPSVRPGEFDASSGGGVRRVAVVTGSRAEFGLLKPVMAAVQAHAGLELLVIAAGSHLIPPAETFREVKKAFPVTDSVPMQKPGPSTRLDDAEAVGRGVSRFARSFAGNRPDWVVVLGDRIEAFAAAAAASVAGIPLGAHPRRRPGRGHRRRGDAARDHQAGPPASGGDRDERRADQAWASGRRVCMLSARRRWTGWRARRRRTMRCGGRPVRRRRWC
ncbi:MAG: hypothetical protein HND58_00675 [Planctomycetota bacterium]|nr:MAG: hypothetical protein HND58_00675 [Planctomycetota bacterium]